jgi:hypothetical protein
MMSTVGRYRTRREKCRRHEIARNQHGSRHGMVHYRHQLGAGKRSQCDSVASNAFHLRLRDVAFVVLCTGKSSGRLRIGLQGSQV